jgi:hypothetical protein
LGLIFLTTFFLIIFFFGLTTTFLTITGGTIGTGRAIGVALTTGLTIFFIGVIRAILITFEGAVFNFFSIF